MACEAADPDESSFPALCNTVSLQKSTWTECPDIFDALAGPRFRVESLNPKPDTRYGV